MAGLSSPVVAVSFPIMRGYYSTASLQGQPKRDPEVVVRVTIQVLWGWRAPPTPAGQQQQKEGSMSSGTFWEDNDLGRKIVEVLAEVTYQNPDHHLGRPFLTAYQLAILFKRRFPEDSDHLGHPVGGAGSGLQYSLASYLAGQLSRKIRSGEVTNIEGGFLSNRQLLRIEFDDDGETITSSSTSTQYDLSMFRYVD